MSAELLDVKKFHVLPAVYQNTMGIHTQGVQFLLDFWRWCVRVAVSAARNATKTLLIARWIGPAAEARDRKEM